ncbi:MAG: NUDIX domain-containing protein [Candidatus Saccharimonadales bacterium]
MPHIHTEPNQHDMTISAYILLLDDNVWKCLVHFHRKIEVLMQIGGHIELTETPWQAMAHELKEESGYSLAELMVLQHTADRVVEAGNIQHPTPFMVNTHNAGNDHYHSDSCYGFVAKERPKGVVSNGESIDLRWLTIDQLSGLVSKGEALEDVRNIYRFLLEHLGTYARVPAIGFSLEKPKRASLTYKTGAPGA